MQPISFERHRFPPDVIRYAVWLYFRFTLSIRDIEELLAERGIEVSRESVRCWVIKFGPLIAANRRRRRERKQLKFKSQGSASGSSAPMPPSTTPSTCRHTSSADRPSASSEPPPMTPGRLRPKPPEIGEGEGRSAARSTLRVSSGELAEKIRLVRRSQAMQRRASTSQDALSHGNVVVKQVARSTLRSAGLPGGCDRD